MKLLVLEDGGDFARVLETVLRSAGIAVQHCGTGPSLRTEIDTGSPDVLLIDADTAGQTGLEILKEVRRSSAGSQIPVILTSGILFEHEEPIQQALTECGVNRFLRRPIQVLDLEPVIQEVSQQPVESQVAVEDTAPGPPAAAKSSPPPPGTGRFRELPQYRDVQYRHRTSRGHRKPPKPRTAPEAAPSQDMRKPDRGTDAMLTLRRLRRETLHLQEADDWTVLGIPRGRDLEMVETARLRMSSRYTEIANQEGYSDEIHNLALAIAKRVEQAAEKLAERIQRNLEVVNEPPPPPEPDQYTPNPGDYGDQYFLQGQASLAAGDIPSAIRFLRQARDENLNSARNMAWLGWAFYQDKDRPKKERRTQALELLELADQFDSEFIDGQFFLARVEADSGLFDRAAARLRRVLRERKEHLGARRLYEQVQAQLAQPQAEEA